jgi:hypothetical protein
MSEVQPPIHLLIEVPVTKEQLAAMQLFIALIVYKDYTPCMLSDVMMALPPEKEADE